MGVLSDLYVRLGLNAEGFTSGMQQVSTQINSALRASNKGLSGFRNLGNQMKSVGQSMSIGLTLPLAGLAGASLRAAGDIESLKMGLDAVMGSSTEASAELKNLKVVAELPGLGFEEAIQGSVRLQAVGYSADQARAALQGFGNAVATTGGGRAELDRVITQLTQMASAGKLLTQDLRPVIQTVPLVGGVLLDLYGTIDASEINEQLAAQGKSAKDFVNDVTVELGKLPQVTGGLKNAFENLSDTTTIAFGQIGAALAPIAETAIPMLAAAITQAADAFTGLSPAMQSTVIAAGATVAALGPLLLIGGNLITSFMALKGALIALPAVMGSVGAAAVGLKGAFMAVSGVLAGPVGLIALVGTALVGAYILLDKNFVHMEGTVGAQTREMAKLRGEYKDGKITVDQYRESIYKLDPKVKDLDDAQQDAADSAWDLHGKVVDLKRELENQGIEVDETGKSLQEYYDALVEAKKANETAPEKLNATTDALKDQTEAIEESDEAWYKSYLSKTVSDWTPPPIPEFTAAIRNANEELWNSVPPLGASSAGFNELAGSVEGVSGGILQSAEDLAATTPKFEESADRTKSAWDGAMQSVSTNISNTMQKLVGMIGPGGGSVFEALESLGKSIIVSLTEPWAKAISDFITGSIKDLIGSLTGSGGVMGAFGKVGDAIAGAFGGGSSVASGAAGAAGAAGSAGSSAAGAASSAMSGVAGAVTAISSVISAVGSIAQFIQGFQIEAGLDAVEEESRKNQLHNLFSLEKLNEYLPVLKDINDTLLSWGGASGILGEINSSIQDMRVGGLAEVRMQIVEAVRGMEAATVERLSEIATETRGVRSAIQTLNINVTASSEASASKIADAIALRLQGVTA